MCSAPAGSTPRCPPCSFLTSVPHVTPPPPPPPHLLVAASLQVFLTCDCVFIPSSAERPPLRPQGLFVPRSSSTNLPPSSPTIQMGSTHHFKRNNKTHFHFKEKGTDCISRCGPHPREPAVISATFFFLSLFPSRDGLENSGTFLPVLVCKL